MGLRGRAAVLVSAASLPIVGLAAGCSPASDGTAAGDGAATSLIETEEVSAVRQDVVETQKAEATVGFGSIVTLPLTAAGIVTWSPTPRDVLQSGDVVVEVAARPIVLVVGDSPLYRPLRLVARGERDVAGNRIGLLEGTDVSQLQQFLLDEGFDDQARLEVDEVFGTSTHRAVKDWQTAVGHPATGVIDSSQMVFMVSNVLVESDLNVGQQFEQMNVTGTETILTVQGSTTLRDFFAVGSTVEVDAVPAVTGVVTRSVRVTVADGSGQLIEITVDGVAPDDLGQSVSVVGSVSRATDALTIPVRALLADSDGGWQVEVVSGSGTTMAEVELLEVVETTAIIEGIDDDASVVVPV